MIPPFTASFPRSDEGVAGALVMHLASHDARFRPGHRRCEKNRARAKRAALKTLSWWREKGQAEYGDDCDDESGMTVERKAAMRSAVTAFLTAWLFRLLASLVIRWIEKKVVELLTDWLTQPASATYRTVCQEKEAPPRNGSRSLWRRMADRCGFGSHA